MSYSFPLLEISDLVATIKEFIPEIDINEADFGRPKRERWEVIYQSILTAATHCNVETLFQPQLEGLSSLDHADLYEKSIPLSHLFNAMQQLMTICFVEDFHIFDIIDPKPARLRKLCSAIVNYMRFLSERLPAITRIRDESKALVEQREVLLKENDDLQQEINQLKAARSKREPEINMLKEKNMERTARLSELQVVISEKNAVKNTVKTTIAENKAKLAKVEESMAVAKEESNRLSGLIVQSPERMKTDMDRMHAQLAKLKRDKDEKMNKLVELQRMKDQFCQRQADCEQALKLLTDISQHTTAEKKVLGEIGNIRDQAQAKKEQLNNMQVDEKQKRRILTSKQEKLAKMTLQHEGKVTGLQHDIQVLEQKITQMQSIHSAEESEVAKIQSFRHKLAEQDERSAKKHNDDVTGLADKYSELLQQLDAYHSRLGDAWEQVKREIRE